MDTMPVERCRGCKCCDMYECNHKDCAIGVCPCRGNTETYTLTISPLHGQPGETTAETITGSAALGARFGRGPQWIAANPIGVTARDGMKYEWTSAADAIPETDDRGFPVIRCTRCSGTGTFCGGVCFRCQGCRYEYPRSVKRYVTSDPAKLPGALIKARAAYARTKVSN